MTRLVLVLVTSAAVGCGDSGDMSSAAGYGLRHPHRRQ